VRRRGQSPGQHEPKGHDGRGELPACKYSVRISRYAGGRSLNVRISGTDFPLLSEERLAADHENRHVPGLVWQSAKAIDIQKKVEAIVAAYNFDGSEIQSDYFHVNFHSHVDFDHTEEHAQREAFAAKVKAEKSAAKAPVLTTSTCRPLAPFPKAETANDTLDEVDEDAEVLRRSARLPELPDTVTAAEGWLL
jgi:hypothetical protein